MDLGGGSDLVNWKITTLIENKSAGLEFLKTEHGLSILIESPQGNVLMDTGQTGQFIENAQVLGVDLKKIDQTVLSHGHYDHAGGFMALLPYLEKSTTLWFSQFIHREKFKLEGENRKYIGNPFQLHEFISKGFEPRSVIEDVTLILPNVFIVTNFERNSPLENDNPKFVYRDREKYVVDTFDDEISLVLKTESGLVVILGCAHPGVINMLSTIRKRFVEPIHMLIGGTHLNSASDERIKRTIEVLKEMEIERIGVSHCTGDHAVEMFREAFQDGFFENNTGTIIEIS
jgi:7,8-dihydropterin-6-yl-methyl-4-(beta-D-ribofuranosyl)aminobenzene 5'-phosphate synthase